MDIIEKSESILKNHYIIFENISFKRNDTILTKEKTTSEIVRLIKEIETNKYKVSLELNISSIDKNFELAVTVSGLFEIIDCDDEFQRKDLISKNTVAILFPYLRSEVTLLTSQPYFSPIVIPPININKLIEEAEQSGGEL